MSLSRTLAIRIVKGPASVTSVVALLTKYRMLSLLPSIHKAVLQLSASSKHVDTVMIESPFPLSLPALETIMNIVGTKGTTSEVSINKHILAGFKARYKGKLYDGSAQRLITQLTTN